MIRSILVPLDGSPFSEHALPLALTISRRAGCPIEVVHVHAPQDPKHPDWYMPADQRSDPEAVAAQAAYLDAVQRKLSAAGVSASSRLLPGRTVAVLCEHAVASNASLVIMTTHGRGPLSRAWLGSVADALVRQLTVPLLLVRPGQARADIAVEAPFRQILIPLDGSKRAEEILGPALELGKLLGSTFTLLQAVAPVPVLGYDVFGYAPAGTDVELVEQLRQQAGTYLAGIAERLQAQGLHVHSRVVVNPSAAGAILDEAEARGHDLVAIGTHGRGGATRLLLGSVADKIIRGTDVPVLVHRTVEHSS